MFSQLSPSLLHRPACLPRCAPAMLVGRRHVDVEHCVPDPESSMGFWAGAQRPSDLATAELISYMYV